MGTWNALSNELAQAIQEVGRSIVTIQAEGGRIVSGILIDEQKIVTTASVISDAEKVNAWISPNELLNASVVGSDSGTDIALLTIEEKIGSVAVFEENPKLDVGQLVVAIGRTWRGNLVASSGILSGLMGEWQSFRGTKIEAFIRPDLNLYSGFSGGALIGTDRKIIGMNTRALHRKSPLTIPYATIKRVIGVLSAKGYIPKPYLGVGLQPVRLPESLKHKLNLTQQMGALIIHVESASPADKSGFLPGDILLSVENYEFGQEGTASIVFRLTPNSEAKIAGIRGGQHFSSTVMVGERPRKRV